jgi:hypothetical protein
MKEAALHVSLLDCVLNRFTSSSEWPGDNMFVSHFDVNDKNRTGSRVFILVSGRSRK